MTPTLQLFTRALLTPDLSFKTLADARAATGAGVASLRIYARPLMTCES